MTSLSKPGRVVVIGGGIVGVCSASWLLRRGYSVTILEPNGIGDGSSFGNAGCFNASSVVPVSMPGNLPKVPGWMMDPLGPLAIRWSYLPTILPWLGRFIRAGSRRRVFEQARALAPLLRDPVGAYVPLVENAGARDLVRRDGHLMVYRDRAAFEADGLAWRLRRENGIPWIELADDALWEHEPAISREHRFAIFLPENGHTIDPKGFVMALANAFVRDGGRIVEDAAQGFELFGNRLVGVRSAGGTVPADKAVVAAGAHSRKLALQLGDRLPLDTERGYHVMIRSPEVLPRAPIMHMDGKFVATPMAQGLRIAGTVEFAGLEAAPNWKRADKLLSWARRLFPSLASDHAPERISRWMGFRPSMPDSLPVIDHAARSRDIVYAFGHGHVGMAAGARTGAAVADLIDGRNPEIPTAPFSARRFA
jgi:D-amino-acid dehydrogenase